MWDFTSHRTNSETSMKVLTLQSMIDSEGPDYSTPDPWMWENHYPYHQIYIWAIQGIVQAPVAEVVRLTAAERDALKAKAAGARPYKSWPRLTKNDLRIDSKAWCAKWLLTRQRHVQQSMRASIQRVWRFQQVFA